MKQATFRQESSKQNNHGASKKEKRGNGKNDN